MQIHGLLGPAHERAAAYYVARLVSLSLVARVCIGERKLIRSLVRSARADMADCDVVRMTHMQGRCVQIQHI